MKSLHARHDELADTSIQLKVLNGRHRQLRVFPSFTQKLKNQNLFPLKPAELNIFQVNVGYMCNQTCSHCHVDAGPDRKEIMTRETMELCLDALDKTRIATVDLTGGAPEMNPNFRWFVEELSARGKKIIVRCNLTIILANPKYHDLPDFFARHKVEVISSLPYYSEKRTDSQRGEGVFEKSIRALKMLNDKGYGLEGSGLNLHLVFNPSGAFLPPSQQGLEKEFKRNLWEKHGIRFNNLLAITNMPISRFLDYLIRSGNYDQYMDRLINAYNPAAAENVMCRNTISVGWDGILYDCDFNQMLNLPVEVSATRHISDFNSKLLRERSIVVNQHCYGCTAGAGSSCGGEVT